jgi:hypothetical protein
MSIEAQGRASAAASMQGVCVVLITNCKVPCKFQAADMTPRTAEDCMPYCYQDVAHVSRAEWSEGGPPLCLPLLAGERGYCLTDIVLQQTCQCERLTVKWQKLLIEIYAMYIVLLQWSQQAAWQQQTGTVQCQMLHQAAMSC